MQKVFLIPYRIILCLSYHATIITTTRTSVVAFQHSSTTRTAISWQKIQSTTSRRQRSRFASPLWASKVEGDDASSFSSTSTSTSTSVWNATASETVDKVDTNNQSSETLLTALERDVTHVLSVLRPWKYDPEIPAWFRVHDLSFTNYWGLDEWERHASRTRYVRYLKRFGKSRLLRRLAPQLAVLGVWCGLSCLVWRWLVRASTPRTALIKVPMTSLSVVSTFVAALQAMRTNQGLARLEQGRKAMGAMVLHTRDTGRYTYGTTATFVWRAHYGVLSHAPPVFCFPFCRSSFRQSTALLIAAFVYPRHPETAVRIVRHLALFGFLLKSHLRGSSSQDVIATLLVDEADIVYVCGARKTPVACLQRIRHLLATLAQSSVQPLGSTEHRLMEDNLRQCNQAVMVGEKIRATPIPPVYSAHAARLLMAYLGFLPLALLDAQASAVATFAITMTGMCAFCVEILRLAFCMVSYLFVLSFVTCFV